MTERNERDQAPRKKRYEPPQILETAEFETLALACGKLAYPGTPTCYGPQVSSS